MDNAKPTNGASIDIQNLSFSIADGAVLVKPTSLSVNAGQFIAIVGPNGAGKSTLMRLLAGVLKPSTGSIKINSESLHDMPPTARAKQIALLSQTDHADPHLRVIDYVELGCLPHRNSATAKQLKDYVAQAMQRCNLHSLADRHLGNLSGGERQRAHLARALAQQPQLLLLDEPTNHLDPRATLDLMHGVTQLGITVIAVLHDIASVPRWADKVIVMHGGALVAFNTPEKALSSLVMHEVFGVQALYLTHPTTFRPILVMERAQDEQYPPASTNAKQGFFTSQEGQLI